MLRLLIIASFLMFRPRCGDDAPPSPQCMRSVDGGDGEDTGLTCPSGFVVVCPESDPVPFCVYDPGEEVGRARCREIVGDLVLPPFPSPTCEPE